jgi:Rod binding domain-containing protein
LAVNLSLTPLLQPISADAHGRLQSIRRLNKPDAPQDFEALVLQSFIQEMLPKKAEVVFGGGAAGDIWRSMLAEKLAAEVALRGGIGIADLIRTASPAVAAASAPAKVKGS